MRSGMIMLGFACGVAATLLTVHALDPGESLGNAAAAAEQPDEEMEKTWRQFAFPGPEHEKLEFFEGEWDVATTMWMRDSSDPAHSTATLSSTLIFGGRFLQSKMRGTTTFESDGKMEEYPIEGIGYTGFDNFKKKFVSVWIDSNATGIYYMEGVADATGKMFLYFGTHDDWQTGVHDKPMKYVDRILDDNTLVSEFYALARPEGEVKFMEMRATRRTKR